VSAAADPPDDTERRKYPRVAAPMYFRPARRRLLRRRKVVDLGLGGMRVYSDDRLDLGQRMDLDLMLASGDDFVTCLAEVVWIKSVPGGQPAAYDVGLQFLDVPPAARAMIERLVDEALAASAEDA